MFCLTSLVLSVSVMHVRCFSVIVMVFVVCDGRRLTIRAASVHASKTEIQRTYKELSEVFTLLYVCLYLSIPRRYGF